jgi:hypothetical protein
MARSIDPWQARCACSAEGSSRHGTGLLMSRIYEDLVAGASPARALRIAMLWLRDRKPKGYITPTPEVPSHYLDSGRFRLEQLRDPYQAAEQLPGAWLSMFRTDPLFDRLRADE